MIRYLALAAVLAAPVMAQTTAGGATAPYTPAGVMPPPGTSSSGPGRMVSPSAAVVPALPQPSTGATPPIGTSLVGTIGDGRVGTLAPGGSTSPAVNGQPGLPVTTGVSPTTPTTNPPPR